MHKEPYDALLPGQWWLLSNIYFQEEAVVEDDKLIELWEAANVERGSRRGAINPLRPADLARYRAAHPNIDPLDIDKLVEANGAANSRCKPVEIARDLIQEEIERLVREYPGHSATDLWVLTIMAPLARIPVDLPDMTRHEFFARLRRAGKAEE